MPVQGTRKDFPTIFGRQELRGAHRTIAQYVCDQPWKSLTQSAAEIGEATGVSASTVVRFAQAVGFSGLPELQRALASQAPDILRARESIERVRYASEQLGLEHAKTSYDVFRKVIDREHENLEKTASLVTADQFEAVVSRVINAESLYVLGLRGSRALAVQLAVGMRYVRSGVTLLDNTGDDLPSQLTSVTSKDALCAFSYSPYASKTVKVAKAFKSLGGAVVTLTDAPTSPMASLADETIVTHNPVWFSSTTAGSGAVVNALVYAVAARTRGEVRKQVDKARRLVAELEEFELDSMQNLLGIIDGYGRTVSDGR
ncbi:MAG TPA: MurR/RpiR family transcriptional regulator [Gammaproteobacteria bacterium]|nr:MurR/RpiR family transcriptional regulator [Gammaproteobacteria bacterium]